MKAYLAIRPTAMPSQAPGRTVTSDPGTGSLGVTPALGLKSTTRPVSTAKPPLSVIRANLGASSTGILGSCVISRNRHARKAT